MGDLPQPPLPPEVDCTDLDGFMLNVERLMASELVALSSHEVIGAALFLWCRAWKQTPAASLPDDDRVLAAFAKLPLPRFKKLKSEVLHGFVKCDDGRLYHRVLAAEALRAYEKKLAFQTKRETDAERLRKWREKQKANAGETRFVPEGQGQYRDSTGTGTYVSPLPPARQGNPEFDLQWFQDLQANYPPGTYRQATWLTAERSIRLHLERGATAAEIRDGVDRYRAQCIARGDVIGTQFVMGPAKFFDLTEPQFREPFPPPASKAQIAQDANVTAAQEWLARSAS